MPLIKAREKRVDLVFQLEDHSILHLEEEIELIMVPLMGDMKSSLMRLEKAIQLTKDLNKPENEIQWMIAMELIMMNKHISRKELERHWEEVSKLKIMEYAFEKGIEKGMMIGEAKRIALGKAGVREEGRIDFLWCMILRRFPKVPYIYYEKVKELNKEQMDQLGGALFKMKDLDDFESWF